MLKAFKTSMFSSILPFFENFGVEVSASRSLYLSSTAHFDAQLRPCLPAGR
jgi:hypothetical protein